MSTPVEALVKELQNRVAELEAESESVKLRERLYRDLRERDETIRALKDERFQMRVEFEKKLEEKQTELGQMTANFNAAMARVDDLKLNVPAEDEVIVKREALETRALALPHHTPEGKKHHSPRDVEALKTFASVLRRTEGTGSNLANSIWAVLNSLGENL